MDVDPAEQNKVVCAMVETETSAICIIHNKFPKPEIKKVTILVRPKYKLSQLFDDIKLNLKVDNFNISIGDPANEIIVDRSKMSVTVDTIGINFEHRYRNILNVIPIIDLDLPFECGHTQNSDQNFEDDLALGASASPTLDSYTVRVRREHISSTADFKLRMNSGYVGLVNQAMTCYLNSLLQALFMTPEFRNALYNWEFDNKGEIKSIPFQLQKLFLNLQTTDKSAVETTDLTKSFGWDSSEAWQQHDIQELYRVMFDALEQKFKNTDQADLINKLYEGKMIDYVKCLECSTNKFREDKFLDIPLPVRSFGSNVAYGSVEEALRAFVQPETLDGNNQYFCEKCNKKCDAHKGLKFTKFPYILTLHLKRFDFDYQTLNRIKLNDKVTFPQTLNINSFVKDVYSLTNLIQQTTVICDSTSSEHGSIESAIKSDDCSTTDSGSALEEDSCPPSNYTNTNNTVDPDLQDDDEGIEMSSTDTRNNLNNENGPYIYELFAIMIHSGSASGGHYYAYIKDFERSEWYCFNDQTVTMITLEDIQKSFGGGYSKTYYSGAFSPSTNAYLLMYRQIDSTKNAVAMKVDDFPGHIKQLLKNMKEKAENDKKIRETSIEVKKLKVYYFNPKQQQLQNANVFIAPDSTLEEAEEDAFNRCKMEHLTLNRCRLVAYDDSTKNIYKSFPKSDRLLSMNEILSSLPLHLSFLLETLDGNEFEVILPGNIVTKVYTIDTVTSDIDGPTAIRVQPSSTILEYKKLIGNKLNWDSKNIVVTLLNNGKSKILELNENRLKDEDVTHDSKIFVTNVTTFDRTAFLKIVDRFEYIITLLFALPNTDKEILESMSIPAYESSKTATKNDLSQKNYITNKIQEGNDVVDAVMNVGPSIIPSRMDICSEYVSNLPSHPPSNSVSSVSVDAECNSEDSSLSDSDRTLVEEMDYNTSSCNSPITESENVKHKQKLLDTDTEMMDLTNKNYYFKAVYFDEPVIGDETIKTKRMLKVLVDVSMKLQTLKENLQSFVKVPMEYFKIFRMSSGQAEKEVTNLSSALKIFNDEERLTIELGRALRDGEYKCKVYYLKLSEITDDTDVLPVICEWIVCNGASVGQTKRELLSHLRSNNPQYDISFEKCRLRKRFMKSLGKVYLDEEKFGDDIILTGQSELILQEIEDTSQPNVSDDDVCLFVRRWNPATMSLDHFQEIVINDKFEIKQVLSEISNISKENIQYMKVNGNFPMYKINRIGITSSCWESETKTKSDYPFSMAQDGNLYLYKDKTEKDKELTMVERREITNKDKSRLDYVHYQSHSPRKERALKIYLDSPQKTDG